MILFSTFQRTVELFSIVVVPFVLSWKKLCESSNFSTPLPNILLYVFIIIFLTIAILCVCLNWLVIMILIWVSLILNNTDHFFPIAYWPFIHILRKNVYSFLTILCVSKLFQYNFCWKDCTLQVELSLNTCWKSML